MEFSVFRQVLIRALGHMQSIVEKRATLPILMNVKLEVALIGIDTSKSVSTLNEDIKNTVIDYK